MSILWCLQKPDVSAPSGAGVAGGCQPPTEGAEDHTLVLSKNCVCY